MMDKPGCNESHERLIRRREEKVSDVGGIDDHRLSPLYYTLIAEINNSIMRHPEITQQKIHFYKKI